MGGRMALFEAFPNTVLATIHLCSLTSQVTGMQW